MDISVIVPCYNHELYIEQCLRSVIDQSLKPVELIFIDDGSNDNSYQIAEKVLQGVDDMHVYIERQDNIGAHNTINKGIRLSKSEYVTVINSDDVFDKDRFLHISQKAPIGFEWAFTGVEFIGNCSSGDKRVVNTIKEAQQAISELPSVGFAFLAFNVAITTGNIIIKKELLALKSWMN